MLLGVAVAAAPAQAQKLGYVDQQAVLFSMPGMQDVQQEMQKEMKQQQRQLQQQRQEFQKQVEQFQQQQSLLDDSARAERQRELQQRQRELQQSTRQQQRQLQQQRQEMMQPLLEKLQGAIDKVSAQQDLEAVFRREVLLYDDQTSDQVVDITRDVASELGISLSQTPGEPSVARSEERRVGKECRSAGAARWGRWGRRPVAPSRVLRATHLTTSLRPAVNPRRAQGPLCRAAACRPAVFSRSLVPPCLTSLPRRMPRTCRA